MLRKVITLALLVVSNTLLCAEYRGAYLGGYPRSGNHWMRHVLEDITGIATGSIGRDMDPPHLPTKFEWGGFTCDGGYEGECRMPEPGDVVVLKSHMHGDKPLRYKNAPVVQLVRFPFDAIYSWSKHPAMQRKPKKWKVFIREQAHKWERHYQTWSKRPNVIVRYEDLLFDTENQVAKICVTYGMEATPEQVAHACARYAPFGEPGKHMQHYSQEDIADIVKIIGLPLFEKYGYLELLEKGVK